MRLSHFTEAQDELILFRGDASKIDFFDINKTKNSIGLLFGYGIYLTDDESVALDYTVKGGWKRDGSGTVLVRDAESEQEAVRIYLNQIMVSRLGWIQARDALKTEATNNLYNTIREMDRFSPEYNEVREKMNADFKKSFAKLFSKYLKKAKAIYLKEKPLVHRDGTGIWSVVSREHSGIVTKFAIPLAYCRSTLHGDDPLTDRELNIVMDFLIKAQPEGYWKEFPEKFKHEGQEYAWQGRHMGGKAINPSLDEIWNGTHAGMSILGGRTAEFISHLQQHGFNGIAYHGGKRMGSHVRGGGGKPHQSFVFWDDAYINSCRIEDYQASYPSPEIPITKINSRDLRKNWIEPRDGTFG